MTDNYDEEMMEVPVNKVRPSGKIISVNVHSRILKKSSKVEQKKKNKFQKEIESILKPSDEKIIKMNIEKETIITDNSKNKNKSFLSDRKQGNKKYHHNLKIMNSSNNLRHML